MSKLGGLNLYPWQSEVLGELLYRGGRVFALSMPTGSGKTLTALLYAIGLGVDKIIYLVRTINEERAPWKEWLMLVKSGVARGSIATLHGKARFCPEGYIDEDGESVMQCSECWYNAGKSDDVEFGDFLIHGDFLVHEALNVMGIIDPTVPNIRVSYSRAMGLKPPEAYCVYPLTLQAVKYARLIVGPYPYLLLPQIADVILDKIEDSESMLVIIDEVHNLDGLTDLVSTRVSPGRLASTAEAIIKLCSEVDCEPLNLDLDNIVNALKAIADDLSIILNDWANGLDVGSTVHVKDPVLIKGILNNAYNALKPIVNLVRDIEGLLMGKIDDTTRDRLRRIIIMISDDIEVRKIYSKIVKTAVAIDKILQYIDKPSTGWGVYVYREKRTVGIMLRPLLAKEVYKDILNTLNKRNTRFLLMSGTLPSKKYIEHVYGFKVDATVERRPRLGVYKIRIDASLTSLFNMRSREMYERYGKRISEIANNAKPGVVLVVYPSYKFMNSVLSHLNINNVVVFNEGDTKELSTIVDSAIKAVKNGHKVVVNAVAGGRFTEGIEVKDGDKSLIKNIIIAGVPFPNKEDAVFKDMAKASGLGESALMNEIGRIRTLQAIGRGIRGLNDTVTVWLLDKRFAGPRGLAVRWGLIRLASGH
jgi:DNA excision repair protein ERCC-2